MKKKLLTRFGLMLGAGAMMPLWAFAQTSVDCSAAEGLNFALCRISEIINGAMPIVVALGVLYFMWGVISYAIAKDEEAKTTGRGHMINGLIAIMVLVSIWGLVSLLKSTLGLGNVENDTVQIPCIESPGVYCN